MGSWIDGSPATLDAAAAEAARLLTRSRLPIIAGLGTDIAGARAAIALAQRIGGVVDHMHADVLLRDLDTMREAGVMATTPNEARLRADTLLLAGAALSERPQLARQLLAPPAAPELDGGVKRRVFRLCPGATKIAGNADVQTVGRNPKELPVVLAALRARVAGRPISGAPVPVRTLDALATGLQAARFGVAIWSVVELDALAVEMLCGLVDDLNAHTRFTGLALPPPDNAAGVQQACGWMTGFPMRTGFARGFPEHDPWRFAATRLIDSGEADCAMWISAYGDVAPGWRRAVPTIALTWRGAGMRAQVHIEVGQPGIDHDAVEHRAGTATLAPVTAAKPSETISVAQAIARIHAALPERGLSC
jgi:formylmethanofuran dehydrogenase subunit B